MRIAWFPLLAAISMGCRPSSEVAVDSPSAAGAESAEAATPAKIEPPSCARRAPNARLAPLGAADASGSVVLARTKDRTLAYVADEDDAAVRAIDVDSAAEVATTPLAGAPSSLLILADGRVVVALRDLSRIEVFEPPADLAQPLERRCTIPVAAEPVGLAVTPDGATLLVASRWAHALTALDAMTGERRFQWDLPRDPGSVLASSDGTRAFVSHVAGSRVSVVDLAGGGSARSIDLQTTSYRRVASVGMVAPSSFFQQRSAKLERREHRAGQGFVLVRAEGGRILAPQVLVDTGNGVRTAGYGEAKTVFGDVAPIAEADEKRAAPPGFGASGGSDCLLPRSAAVDPIGGQLLVACLGIDVVVAYDAKARSPHDRELRRWRVGAGPRGIAVDAEARRMVVWAQFDQRLSVLRLDNGKAKPLAQIVVERRTERPDPQVARGRVLFHAAGDRRFAFDGRACASCHPDGRDDALTWTTPVGRRQTPMLLGRLEDTAPYGWNGAGKDLMGHVTETEKRLSGTGITAVERQALIAYLGSLRAPDAAPTQDRAVEQGAALFHAQETGCASCHLGDEALTDRQKHDVKSRGRGDPERSFDTPSLRFVGQSPPYFHDGRYATLGDVLRAAEGTMGHTAHLSPFDLAALEAYLASL